MSFWMEVRCDHENPADRCLSNRNEGPMTSSGLTRASLSAAAKRLKADAVKEGWRIGRKAGHYPSRIYCPACKGRMT